MFRSGGIYVLPNGRELMASGDGSRFYGVGNSGEVMCYELNDAGRLLLEGRLTAWSAADLRDSTQTVEVLAPVELSLRARATRTQ